MAFLPSGLSHGSPGRRQRGEGGHSLSGSLPEGCSWGVCVFDAPFLCSHSPPTPAHPSVTSPGRYPCDLPVPCLQFYNGRRVRPSPNHSNLRCHLFPACSWMKQAPLPHLRNPLQVSPSSFLFTRPSIAFIFVIVCKLLASAESIRMEMLVHFYGCISNDLRKKGLLCHLDTYHHTQNYLG